MERDRAEIQQELRDSIARVVSKRELAIEIAALLETLGRKVDKRVVADQVTALLAARFVHKSSDIQMLIKHRPEQLEALIDSSWGAEFQNIATD